MKYQDIKTFHQRVQDNKPTSEAEINATLLEEVAELRHYIEWHMPKAPTINFCPRCGKRAYPDTIHTCTPPADNWAHPTNNIAA